MELRSSAWILTVAVFANFSQFAARLLISPLVPDLIDNFRTSKAAMGLALTGMWVTFAGAHLLSGLLSVRVSERWIIISSLGSVSLISVLVPFAQTFLHFSVLLLGLGTSAGLYFPAGVSLVTRLYESTGHALSIHTIGGSLAGLIVPTVTTAVASIHGWRTTFFASAGMALLTCALLFWQLRSLGDGEMDSTIGLDVTVLVELMTRPPVLFTVFIGAIGMYTFQSFVSFFPTFLIEYWHFSPQISNAIFSVIFLVVMFVLLGIGQLSDQFSRDVALLITFSGVTIGMLLFITGGPHILAIAGVGFLGVGLAWSGVLQSRFMDTFASEERTVGFGFGRAMFLALGSIGNTTTAVFAQRFGWGVSYGVIALLATIVVGMLACNRIFDIEL